MDWDDARWEECWHEEYEADINARATCCSCGHTWYLTAQEVEWERQLVKSYDRMMRREEWRLWMEGWVRPLAFWRRWRKPATIDDDIPF